MYIESIKKLAADNVLKNKSILVTGATGLIGSCLIDVLIEANINGANNTIYAMGRSKKRLLNRFGNNVISLEQNIIEPIDENFEFDYIFHGASNADPKSYATQPVETILTNIIGNKNMLDYCRKHTNCKMLLTSTFEVYGDIAEVDEYSEDMSGVIDQTVLRNGYPESKRSCELLLRSYVDEYNVSAVIARLPSVYGPTMLKNDSKAHAQFIKNALNNQDIVLKSKGEQKRTYCYVVDVVSALLTIIEKGNTGEVYNVSNEKSIATIAEVAKTCAEISGTRVVIDLPDEIESKGFSKSKNCILRNERLKSLGWEANFSLKDGLIETIEYLRGE